MVPYHALEICINIKFLNIWIEEDAANLIKIISSNSKRNVDLIYLVLKTKNLLSKMPYKIYHILRKGNSRATFLATLPEELKWACKLKQINFTIHKI